MYGIEMIIIALIFNGLDFTTGLIQAFKNKDLHSSKLRNGLFKKSAFLLCYILAWLIDVYGGVIGLSISVRVLPIIIGYTVFTEIISIIENISLINEDILPETLEKLLHINNINKEE